MKMLFRDEFMDVTVEEIENKFENIKLDYPNKQLKLIIDEDNFGTSIAFELYDVNDEVHLFSVYPSSVDEMKVFDKKRVCGKKLSHLLNCRMKQGRKCNGCRKCYSFME